MVCVDVVVSNHGIHDAVVKLYSYWKPLYTEG